MFMNELEEFYFYVEMVDIVCNLEKFKGLFNGGKWIFLNFYILVVFKLL